MAETTEFLGLTLPAGSDRIDISVINENFEMLDMQAKANDAKASAAQNAAGTAESTATAAQSAAAENAEAITAVSEAVSGMSRTLTARTEAEVREALQFAADHPGSYLYLTLSANLNVTIPTLYFRNCTIHIIGTLVDKAVSNTVTFEKTGTTSNLHLQNSMLYTVGVKFVGNTTAYSRGIGVIRAETGSSVYIENAEFEKEEGSGAFGNNIEVQNTSKVCAKNCTFRSMSTANQEVAAVVFCQNGAEATLINCIVAEDSVVKRIANAESGGTVHQIGTDYDVVVTNYGLYSKNGVWQNQTAASEDGS